MKKSATGVAGAEYDRDQIISVPEGMPGFETCTEYVMRKDGRYASFVWLISTERPELKFLFCPASKIIPDYSPAVSLEDTEYELFFMSHFDRTGRRLTANTRAPLAVWPKKRTAKQLILTDRRYPLRKELMLQK